MCVLAALCLKGVILGTSLLAAILTDVELNHLVVVLQLVATL